MRKTFFLIIFIFCCLFLFSKYEINLKLDKILNESQLETEMKPTDENSFNDDWISIQWIPTPDGFNFTMINKINTTLSIIWDDSAFINEEGNTSKVMHGGVKFTEKGQSLPPTNIPLLAKIQDVILPVDYCYFGTAKKLGWGSGIKKWRNNPIWDEKINDKEFEKMKGKDLTFRVILNVKKGDEKRNYHFFFKAVAKKI